MQVEILELSSECVKFSLVGTTLKVANTLRRVMLDEVAIMAVDTVNIKLNTSVMTNEYTTYRMEMIPFVSNSVDHFILQAACDCGSKCVKCSVVFDIDVTNNETNGLLDVTANDLIHAPFNGEQTDIQPIRYEIPILITKLEKTQSFKARLILRKGFGRTHAKWMVATSIGYIEKPNVVINKELNVTSLEKTQFVQSCPQHVFGLCETTGDIEVIDDSACTSCGECSIKARECNLPQLVTIGCVANHFLFTVRTNGTLLPNDVLKRGMDIVQLQLNALHIPTAQSLERFGTKRKIKNN